MCKDFFEHQAKHLASIARGAAAKLAKAGADDKEHDVNQAAADADCSTLQAGVEPPLRRVAQDAARQALEQVGVSDDDLDAMLAQTNARAVDWAAEYSADLVKGISETTRDRVRELVKQAEAEGWSNDDLADALDQDSAFGDARAEMIARTETARADVTGNVEGWRESGVVAEREWITGEGCCDECDALNGETVAIDRDFEDGDPPLHPNCRCDVSPVVDEPEEDDE